MRSVLRRWLSSLPPLAVLLALVLTAGCHGVDPTYDVPDSPAQEMVSAIGIGWNLGNTLDPFSGDSFTDGWIERSSSGTPSAYETAWGNPVTTRAIIDAVKAKGFRAVRVPVTWGPHIRADNSVEEAWMKRVEEVVGYVLDSGLYCILNVHHDTGAHSAAWLRASRNGSEARRGRYAALWNAIATRFRNRDERLLLESFNEILDDASEWNAPGTVSLAVVNELNQLFVDTVRATGGKNEMRLLIVNTYAASSQAAIIDAFELPSDRAQDRLIVEVHDYSPLDFCWQAEDVSWTTTRDTWGSASDYSELEAIFERLHVRFVQRGIPVIIGEFGSSNKANTAERIEHARAYIGLARERGMACFWWDAGGTLEPDRAHGHDFYDGGALLNRRTLEWIFPALSDAVVDAAKAN